MRLVALDATTGKLKVANTTSGTIAKDVNNGVSMQGNLTIVDGELRFLAGGVYETARYDLQTLECLNEPKSQVTSQFRTAFYPYYPEYGKYVSLEHKCEDGCLLVHDASYEGSRFENLSRQTAVPSDSVERTPKEAARWNRRNNVKKPETVWQDKAGRRFTSFVVAGDTLLATGHLEDESSDRFLVSINTADGNDNWILKMPDDAVKGGTCIDHKGRIYIALENGQLLCYAPANPS